MVKHAAPTMMARKSGKIINIASGTAYKGMPQMLHYVTSKGGVVAFTRALSRELGAHNICVNSLAPGLTLSDSIQANPEHIQFARDRVLASRAIQRDGYPQDLVGALVFLASSDSDFVTGQTIAVDGGSINT
jgi:NAD(P)-dependent dehydrogenase (short-subunit alcohol dehydrogenase family)